MQTATGHKKISRKAFEAELIEAVGFSNLFRDTMQEIGQDGQPTTVTLYYRKTAKPDKWGMTDLHFATWHKGTGWHFEGFDAGVEWELKQ